MTISKKFNEITSYQNSNFQNWFGEMEFEEKESKLFSKKLGKPMNDSEILAEFKPTELTLGEVFHFLSTKARKEDWMVFYCKDSTGVLRAVLVYWFGRGWCVGADALFGYRWVGGGRVFSLNSFDTLTPSTLDPLEKRISAIEKTVEKITKIINIK